ncbi:MAG: D-aminoacylase [Pseudomonadota bacterium]|nr:D-aminoacylase [Pseudomonadota bacterium]
MQQQIVPLSSFDIVFRHGRVIDGSGSASYIADVGLKGDRVTEIGNIPSAAGETEFDITDKVIAPGFIDAHTHDDRALLNSPDMPAKASQGVTTVITGNCGISLAPLSLQNDPPPPLDLIGKQEHYRFDRFADYLTALEVTPAALNAACLVGHSTLRVGAMSDLERAANDDELSEMRKAFQSALDDGALGLSSGTFYPPASAAPASEIAKLAELAGTAGGVYTTHMRDEADHVLDSIRESVSIAGAGGVPLIISHHKVTGKNNHGRTHETLPLIVDAMKKGQIGLDVYPYIAASSILTAHRAAQAERVYIAWSTGAPEQAGRDLADIARDMGTSIEEAVNRLKPAGAVYFLMDEEDVQRVMQFPHTMIGSDGLPHDTHPHPRLWGTFPRVLGHYVRDIGLFSLEEAVRRMTSLTAERFGLTNRGLLRRGFYADLVIFDAESIADTATFANPTRPASGIERVLVNGQEIWRDGSPTGNRPGRPLRRQHLAWEQEQPIV